MGRRMRSRLPEVLRRWQKEILVDSFFGRVLRDVAVVGRVLDTETVLAGMQPSVAMTLVEFGPSLKGIRTVPTVDQGMGMLRGLARGAEGGRNGCVANAARAHSDA